MKSMPHILLILLCPIFAWSEMVTKPISYTIGNTEFAGEIVYHKETKTPMPGIVMVPNWLGPTETSLEKAKRIAGDKYVVFMVDMYGTDVRPTNHQEASQAAGFVRGDRALMRKRINTAIAAFIDQSKDIPLDTDNIAAIGFCFGGGTVLELARSGASSVKGVASFHGNLDTPNPKDAEAIVCKVLVLHGANDPFVPEKDISAFQDEMKAADVDWQFISYGGAVHSFTDPTAKMIGKAEYHPVANARSFIALEQFLTEIFN